MRIDSNARRIGANLKIVMVLAFLFIMLAPTSPSASIGVNPTSLFELRGVHAADFSAVELLNSYKLADKDAVDGDLISSTKNGLVRSKIAFDSQLFGVVSLKPLGAYRSLDTADVPVARNGTANVNVTTLGGKITVGDAITTSEIAGKGQKANSSGYVIGVAMAGFDGSNGSNVSSGGKTYKVGQISVALRIEYAEITSPQTFKRLFDYLGAGFFSSVRNPSQFGLIVRYAAAGLVVLLALAFAFITFSRSIPKAIEAVGRNPLAKTSIYISMAVTIGFMALVIGLGIVAAVILLRV